MPLRIPNYQTSRLLRQSANCACTTYACAVKATPTAKLSTSYAQNVLWKSLTANDCLITGKKKSHIASRLDASSRSADGRIDDNTAKGLYANRVSYDGHVDPHEFVNNGAICQNYAWLVFILYAHANGLKLTVHGPSPAASSGGESGEGLGGVRVRGQSDGVDEGWKNVKSAIWVDLNSRNTI